LDDKILEEYLTSIRDTFKAYIESSNEPELISNKLNSSRIISGFKMDNSNIINVENINKVIMEYKRLKDFEDRLFN
jgi:hypothetical protein